MTEANATAVVATQALTIQGIDFTIRAPYAEGHALNANEASTLNQTFAENIRNNAAARIKKAKEAAEKAGTPFDINAAREDGTTLRAEIEAYAEAYEFGSRVARTTEPVDPVEREAFRIAKEVLDGQLRNKGIKKKDLQDGVYDDAVRSLMQKAEITKLATKRVKEREALAMDDIDVESLARVEPEDDDAGEGEGDEA